MTGFDFLDLVIGLIFIYLIYSIAASALWEIFVNITRMRGKLLHKWVMETFKESRIAAGGEHPEDTNHILQHPLIKSTSGTSKGKPSYISSKVFADALVDVVIRADKSLEQLSGLKATLETFRNNLVQTKMLPDGLKSVFLQYADEASADLQKVKDKIAFWYDEAQERLLGSYKKHVQRWILVISIVLVGSSNADTIKLASYLYNNDDARTTLALNATLVVQDSTLARFKTETAGTYSKAVSDSANKEIIKVLNEDLKVLSSLNNRMKESGLPLGWAIEKKENYKSWIDYLKKLMGLLLTALAVSMGSPFWFDILSSLSNLRSAGNKPKTSQQETAEKLKAQEAKK